MASIRICDRMGCSNQVNDLGWKLNKMTLTTYGINTNYRSFMDVCDDCVFELFGVTDGTQ